MSNYVHKKLLRLRNVHRAPDGIIEAELIDPSHKKGHQIVCIGFLSDILDSALSCGYLIAGVQRPPCHVLIGSGDNDTGPIGCINDGSHDADLLHTLKENPGCTLEITDKGRCTACVEFDEPPKK